MSIDSLMLRNADQVARSIVQNYVCSICIDEPKPNHIGNGTVILIGEHVLIATAMHVVEEYALDQIRLIGWYEEDQRKIPVPQDGRRFQDETNDVAVLTMSRRVLEGSRIRGLPLSRVQPGMSFSEQDFFMISGTTIENSSFDNAASLFEQRFSPVLTKSLNYSIWPRQFEAQRRLQTDPFAATASLEAGPSRSVEVLTDKSRDIFLSFGSRDWMDANLEVKKQMDPQGFSGAGIWRVSNESLRGVANREPMLIGMAVAAEKKTREWVRGIQIQHWLEMVWTEWKGFRSAIDDAGLVRVREGVFEVQMP